MTALRDRRGPAFVEQRTDARNTQRSSPASPVDTHAIAYMAGLASGVVLALLVAI